MAQEPTPSVGVVSVNYNAGDHLLAAVASFRSEGIDDIVVVDNGSSDGSPERQLAADPKVTLLRLPNPGFGAGNNAGVAALDTDVVCLMNPDTVVHPGALATAVDTLFSDDRIGIVGVQLLNPDGSVYPSARAFPRLSVAIGHGVFSLFWPNNPWSRRYKRLTEDYEHRTEVDWVSGAAMIARRDAFLSVGGFDDAFFMYFEDTDLCWRLRKEGWKIVYEPAAQVTHVQGVSTKRLAYRMLKEHHKSAIRYNLRTARGVERIFLPVFILGLLVRLPVAWLQHWVAARRR